MSYMAKLTKRKPKRLAKMVCERGSTWERGVDVGEGVDVGAHMTIVTYGCRAAGAA